MTRPLRADAARNRTNIVLAARRLIAARGPEVGMDDIARDAGVAVGTVYRHFPTKADLIATIVGERITDMLAELDAARVRLAQGASARDELTVMMTTVAERVGEDRALKAAAGDVLRPSLSDVESRAVAALREIVTVGHRQGSLQPGVTTDDLALAFTMLPGDDVPEPDRRRWLALVLRGLLTVESARPSRT